MRRSRNVLGEYTGGFTLIELLTVVAIIGILAAIAVQSMSAYRQKAYDARAVSDLGNAAAAEEAYYAVNFTYISIAPVTGPNRIDTPGFTVSDTVTLQITAADESFGGTASSSRGSGIVYSYDSETDTLLGN